MPYRERRDYGMQTAQLARALRAELDRRLSGLGLSQARWVVLLHLNRFSEMPTQRELANSVGVEGPTLARLLDGLEAQGLIERVAVPEDRRAKKVFLLEKARPVIENIEAICRQMYEDCFVGIPSQELQLSFRVQQKMLENLEKNCKSV